MMKNSRRLFLNQVSAIAAVAAVSKPSASIANITKSINTIHSNKSGVTVYHTNDLYGHFEATGNLGGLKNLRNELEKQDTFGLLIDGGNFIDGNQSLEGQQKAISAMNSIGYQAAAVGANELANGEEHLAKLAAGMKFTLVNCNYQFSGALRNVVKPYLIIKVDQFKIGIIGVGQQVAGVSAADPIQSANKVARFLKADEKCDLVICLSHLGYQNEISLIDNRKLANQSEYIDMIVGGQGRTFMSGPMVMRNKLDHEVILSHTAWNGMMVGKTIFGFSANKQRNAFDAKHIITGNTNDRSFVSLKNEMRG